MWLNDFVKLHPNLKGVGFYFFEGFWWYPPEFSQWRFVSDMTSEEIANLTLIEMPKTMVLLDMDDCSLEEEKAIMKELDELGINYVVWETNRGYHNQIFVDDLENYSDEEVIEIRSNLIEYFGADPCKMHGDMMAIPKRPHFKTGKIVNLIKNVKDGLNKTLPEQFYKIKRKPSPSIKLPIIDWDVDAECSLFEYCCNNKLKENTGRGLTLYKNMSAYLVEKYPEDIARKKFNELCEKQESYQSQWIDFQLTNRQKLSCGELRNWLRKTQYLDVEELTCWRCKNGKE
jgi:hypothetical protein